MIYVLLIALAGIGNPDNFFNFLEDYKLNIIKKLRYPDHYSFSKKNLDNISCYSNEGDQWEKSKIKLENKLLTIEFRGAFFPRRGRINCSLNDDGKWRWFGTQFTIKLN